LAKNTTDKIHYGFLDTLRTIAVALVLLRHTIRPFLPDLSPDASVDELIWAPVRNLMTNGWVGVDLFFILSGFLIAQPFLTSPKASVKNFYRNRGLRILPAYFTVLLLVLIGAFPFYTIPSKELFKDTLFHIFFLQDYTGSNINTVLWSLGVEIKFYIISPLILILTGRYVHEKKWIKAYAMTFAVIALSPLLRLMTYNFSEGFDSYYDFFLSIRSPFHACIDGLFFGVLLSIIFRHLTPYIKSNQDRAKRQSMILLSLLSICTICFMTSHEFMANIGIFDAVIQPFILSALFMGIALSGMCCFYSRPSGVISKWGARISYSTYLVHWPLLPLCIYIPTLLGFGNATDNMAAAIIFALCLWIISTILASLIYHFVERPFLKLRVKIT
jgi:peptidoglycan/LPS O-acetylase OafA/YrhL